MAIAMRTDGQGGSVSRGFGTIKKGPSRGFASVPKEESPGRGFAVMGQNGGTLPVPTQFAPVYQTPAQNMPTNYGNGFDGSGGNQSQVNTTPANPPVDYSKFSTGDLSAMDSTLADQLSLFAQALKRYTADDTRQREDLGSDKDLALGGIGRNEISGLTGLNEDFAARGLGRSGLLFDAQNKAREAFGRQRNNVNTQFNKGIDNLDMKLRNFKAENGKGGSNEQAARRDALARLAAKQSLV